VKLRKVIRLKLKQISAVAGAIAALTLGLGVVAPAQASGAQEITVWAMCSEAGEIAAAREQVAGFNGYYEGDYHATLSCKADMGTAIKSTSADALPSVFEFDGENLAAYVYAQKLKQLDGLVPASVFNNELVSIRAEGTYKDGHKYSVSQYDSGLGLYGSKKKLAAAGIKDVPTTWSKAWTAARFTQVLSALAAKAPGKKALDIKENYGMGPGWPGYAFTPIVNSAGFQLVTNGKAVGSLDNAKVVSAFKTFASWKKYVDPSSDDKAFENGRVGLAWVGHWQYPAFSKALGKDLVVLPLPNFGAGTKSGQGSHSWGISKNTAGSELAAANVFLQYIMQDKWILNVTDQNGAVPATKTALNKSVNYRKGGALQLYGDQLAASCGTAKPTTKCVTVPRTISAAWPVINTAFGTAVQTIWNGGNAQTALHTAALTIDQDYADHNGY
jgi:multiple sugar transport system substrate-binding protein